MSITVSDVLRLPSMVGAEVVAGRAGLQHPVESVTVLEYGHPSEVLDRLFRGTSFEGNELIITAFATIHDDVEAQCANIRKYHAAGSVGMILYYVGIILPAVDQRLINCCDELGFVLIAMPKGEIGRKYGEVLGEVFFEIFQEQKREHFFVSSLLDRISGLPAYQRNIDTLICMLSEHLRATAVLTNRSGLISSISYWPRSLACTLDKQIAPLLKEARRSSRGTFPLGEGTLCIQKCPALLGDMDDLQLYLLKYGELLPDDTLWQASELVRLFIRIWDEDHGKLVASELIRAIINDETLKTLRLSRLFQVQLSALNQLWLFIPRLSGNIQDEQLLQQCSKCFSAVFPAPLIGYYDGTLVICTNAPTDAAQRAGLLEDLSLRIQDISTDHAVVCCDSLERTAEIRRAYQDAAENWELAEKIYPQKRILRPAEIMLAKQCRMIIENSSALQEYQRLLSRINAAGPELRATLATYLLDASSNMAQTAKLLFVHLNTVKYRLRTVQDLTGFAPGKMPDAYHLHLAAALGRILENDANQTNVLVR